MKIKLYIYMKIMSNHKYTYINMAFNANEHRMIYIYV